MELLKPLDKEATVKAAQELLSDYRRQKSYANAPVNPRVTASYGNIGSAGTAPKPQYAEEYAMRVEHGEKFCKWVDWAINSCRKYKSRELLKIVYCEGYEEDHGRYMDILAQRLGRYDFSSSTYFEWHKRALLDVAERLSCQIFLVDKKLE